MPVPGISSNNLCPQTNPSSLNSLHQRVHPKDVLLQGSKSENTDSCITSIFKAIGRFFRWIFCCCKSKPENGDKPVDLAQVFKETYDALKKGSYINSKGEKVNIDLSRMRSSVVDFSQHGFTNMKNGPDIKPVFSVQNIDSVEAGIALKKRNLNPVVVNFANEDHPGGGVKGGSRAQEEEICRKTGLYLELDPKENSNLKAKFPDGKYKIPEKSCIYTSNVPVIRQRLGEKYEWLEKPIRLAFISSAAYNQHNRPKDDKEYIDGMRIKIRTQVECAILYSRKSLVLGAFGCGAFGNNPKLVARLYKEEIAKYPGMIQEIVFAVKICRDSDQKNFDAFKQAFPTS